MGFLRRFLRRLGVHGWFLDGIKALYADVPMVVKTAHGQTASFQSVMGVKQGCPLSPTLFGLYLDDLEEAMRAKQHLLDSPSLAGIMLLALLYADDLALVSMSMAGLQAQLDVLQEYADRWGLTVNVDKTKAVIYRAARAPVCSKPKSLNFLRRIWRGRGPHVGAVYKGLSDRCATAPPGFQSTVRGFFPSMRWVFYADQFLKR